jgi:hypothetical protein
MRKHSQLFSVLVLALVALTFAIPAVGETSLVMHSEPGDYIGLGRDYFITDADGNFIGYGSQNKDYAGIYISCSQLCLFWYLDFKAPSGQQLLVGSYPNATRYPFQEPDEPGLDIAGDGRGCNTLTGNFEVLAIQYGPNGELLTLWATFEQHCEGGIPALFGEIKFNVEAVPVAQTTWGAIKSLYAR